jgi:hypothetical protein
MRIFILTIFISLTVLGLVSCSEVKPAEKAAIIGYLDYTMCGGCGGRFVHVDSTWYRADIVAPPYDKENRRVWIRFKKDESDGNKIHNRWIVISSIRDRE